MDKYTLEVKELPESDDLYIELPPELLDRLGWEENDNLVWIDKGESGFLLKRVESKSAHIEKRVHHAIIDEFIELLRDNRQDILDLVEKNVQTKTFNAMKYKEAEEYDRLLVAKKLKNLIAYILRL